MWRLLVAGLGPALASCTPLTVSSYTQPGVSVGAYQTYAWAPRDALPVGDPRLDSNPFFDDHVKASVENQLAARGYRRAGTDPDLLLHYHFAVQQLVDVYRVDQEAGYGNDQQVVQYDEGTLVLDVVDARTNRVVWRGWGQSDIEGLIDDQGALQQRITKLVRKMLVRFPPRP